MVFEYATVFLSRGGAGLRFWEFGLGLADTWYLVFNGGVCTLRGGTGVPIGPFMDHFTTIKHNK
jgi:hypothetical protein